MIGITPDTNTNPPNDQIVLTPDQTAILLGVAAATLEGWRRRGDGPKFLKLGRLVRYRRTDVDAFLASKLVQSTAQSKLPQPVQEVRKPRPRLPLYKGNVL